MPTNEHLVLCSGASAELRGEEKLLTLNRHGASANVRLEIEDISRRLLANLSDVHSDLLDIAGYIYAADSAISRGGKTDSHLGAMWRRKFRFVIPVRRPRLWSSDPVTVALVETIGFLSDDHYEFEFRPLKNPPPVETYFPYRPRRRQSLHQTRLFCSLGAWIRLQGQSRNWLRMARRLRSSAIDPPQRLLRPRIT